MSKSDPRPAFRLACCLCRRRIRGDAFPLDDEWARRYPGMVGRLACHGCALGDRYAWDCERGGEFVPGHIPAAIGGADIDHWSHAGVPHTQVAAVLNFPAAAMVQGGEAYARWVARRPNAAPEVRARILAAIADWEAENSAI